MPISKLSNGDFVFTPDQRRLDDITKNIYECLNYKPGEFSNDQPEPSYRFLLNPIMHG